MKSLMFVLISLVSFSASAQLKKVDNMAISYVTKKGDTIFSFTDSVRFFALVGHKHLRGSYAIDRTGTGRLTLDSTKELILLTPLGKDSVRYGNSILRRFHQ